MVRRRVLLVCVGNSCRSPMAEGWVRRLRGESWLAGSAGTVPAEVVHPLAVEVMAEVGIDIGGHRPRSLASAAAGDWDLVVSLASAAARSCAAALPEAEHLELTVDDPLEAPEASRQDTYRRVRDELRERLVPELDRRS